jgi:hypothetical protein
MPWKKWVRAKTGNEITEQWLTRAVNSGKLACPVIDRRVRSWLLLVLNGLTLFLDSLR